MMYVLVDETTEKAEIFKDSTQVAAILGKSTRSIWYNSKNPCKKWGKYTLYYVEGGVKKSERGNKKGNSGNLSYQTS